MKLTSLKAILFTFLFVCAQSVFADNVLSDTAITTKIKTKIAADQSLSVFHVNVNTSSGMVTLSGKVNSETDAAALIELAQATDGVKDVNTANLRMAKSRHPMTDTAITAKVKGLFVREKFLSNRDVNALGVHVETNNHVVYLSGVVNNDIEAQNAIRLAKLVRGVKKVESRIRVED